MHRLVAVVALLALAPLAHAQSLGELGAAMGVHDAAAGAGMSSATTAHRARETITRSLSATGKGWQASSRSEAHSSGNGWASSAASSGRGVRTSAGWATASAAGSRSGGGWVRRDSQSQRRR
jgi:hypothetical protein